MDSIDQPYESVVGEEHLLNPTISLSNEIKNSSHTHPLVRSICFIELECLICRKKLSRYRYGCFPCNFILCETCARKPLVVATKRLHEHPLNLVPKDSLIFTCHACGVGDHRSHLCICIPCCFIIHRDCADLPRVIYINRHDHRISHVFRIGYGKYWTCRVCHKSVDGEYGSYTCSVCPSYVVHSRCATSNDVWDGEEMEDVPEEDPQELIPFVVLEEGLINHLSHEHDLKLINDLEEYDGKNKQCNACVLPIYSHPNYVCIQDGCDFILHEICANLSKKKRHPSHRSRLTLSTKERYFGVFRCRCCEQTTSGFSYIYTNPVVYSGEFEIDVRCASISEGFVHKSHPHGELSISKGDTICSNCKRGGEFLLKCCECEGFSLCFCCATLPEMVMHNYDTHPLYLCYGEKPNGEYWCEICEKRTDPYKWFYTCEECSSTLHIHCVLGETPYIRCGLNHQTHNTKWDVVINKNASRPRCHSCSSRCEGPYVFKTRDFFFCCFSCLWYIVGFDLGIKMCNLRIRYK